MLPVNPTRTTIFSQAIHLGKSLFLGTPGLYQILGIQVIFQKEALLPANMKAGIYTNKQENRFFRKFKEFSQRCSQNRTFQLISGSYLHVFIHEMGHALTWKYFTGQSSKIVIGKQGGITTYSTSNIKISHVARSIMDASGSFANVAFSGALLMGSCVLRSVVGWPIALIAGTGSALWMTGELLYAHTSAMNRDAGDFGSIARRNSLHLRVASAALLALYAAGMMGSVMAVL